ncbi:autotransporter outer membrane beta-barrel domain-containing protein [Yersinia enterocolitica]|uniref:autotransporter outer membrane beta-barrel domain-containing protein n=1 Tax=Yersinia enterocolitica TaxID=630 RepID=UPI0021AE083D|nr:autotransporter outer membrane beta-barrel domain-containing protein [Yersinia enterocolitica]
MYISNIIQPNGRAKNISSNDVRYRLSPCAKAISTLLLVFSSTFAWADVDTDKKTENIKNLRQQLQQYQEMRQHKQYLLDDFVKVRDRITELKSSYLQGEEPETVKQKEELLAQQLEYLGRQKEQHKHNLEPLEQQLQQDHPSIWSTIQGIELHEATLVNMRKELELEQPPEQKQRLEQKVAELEKDINRLNDQLLQETESTLEITPAVEAAVDSADKVEAGSSKSEKAAAEKAAAAVKPVAPKPAPIIGHNPQVGSYIANQIAAQQMFITDDLQYRLGETRYIDAVTGEEKVSSLWINTSGAKNRFNSGNDQLRTKSNRYAIQLGGTLNKWSSSGDDQGILGVTAGFGKSTSHSHSTSSHHQAQGSVDGYNLGLYSIWYADNHTRLGPYIDLLAQYGGFNNQIKAPNVTTAANYKSYLFTSALETGYKIQLIDTADTKLSLQPRAKVMWQRTSGLQHKEPNAILINVEEDNAVTTKLGMRTVLEFDIDTLSSAKSLQISPSFEANWIHSRVNQGVQLSRAYTSPQRVQDKIELASVNVSPQGNKNIADLKLGIEANIDSNLRLWTYLGHQFGGHNYSDTQATVGMNYRF